MKTESVKVLVERFGQKYSEMLGIDLKTSSDEGVFKWFLAAILFGAPITETSVIKTFRCFENHGVITPQKILDTGWDGLVRILDEGSYTRYDFKTADKLLAVMDKLIKQYKGSLNFLHQQAQSPSDLEKRLKDLGKGIGDTTVSIFLRELRGTWEKADPKPTPLVILAAKNLEIIKNEQPEKAWKELKDFWNKNKVTGKDFINFETALLRIGRDYRRKKFDKSIFQQFL